MCFSLGCVSSEENLGANTHDSAHREHELLSSRYIKPAFPSVYILFCRSKWVQSTPARSSFFSGSGLRERLEKRKLENIKVDRGIAGGKYASHRRHKKREIIYVNIYSALILFLVLLRSAVQKSRIDTDGVNDIPDLLIDAINF